MPLWGRLLVEKVLLLAELLLAMPPLVLEHHVLIFVVPRALPTFREREV